MIFVRIAHINDTKYATEIANETELSAISRGSGISKRSPELIAEKIKEGKAVIAVTATGEWVGFSYFEVWESGAFISNSGLIVAPKFRNGGVAKAIKERVFKMSRRMYPNAKIFSITSGAAIMKMNSRLGFEPVSFAEITHDEHFWEGCKSCVNYAILENKKRCNCLCTAMLFDPAQHDEVSLNKRNNFEAPMVMVLDLIAYPLRSLAEDAIGANAICAALNDIKWFSTFKFPIEGNLPDPVKMTILSLDANLKILNPAGQCAFTVEIQYDHNYTAREILTTIKNHIQCKFTIRAAAGEFCVVEDGVDKSLLVSNNY